MNQEIAKTGKEVTYQLARLVSALGHPLLSASAISAFVFFQLFEQRQAMLFSGFVLGLITLPLATWNLLKTRSGAYTNFDVSVRRQRHSMYWVLSGLMAVACGLAWWSKQPAALCIGLLLSLSMVLLSFLVNSFLKTSLHAATSFFLAFPLLELSLAWGAAMLLMAVLVSSSRLVLKRHSLPEVLSGSFIGSATGALLLYLVHTA